MLRPVINQTVCQICQPREARLACDTRAIVKIDHDEMPYVAFDRCSGCCACVLACSYQAISMHEIGAMIGVGCRGMKVH
jgi:Fe-S-cluster-containing hydrogenase component 2